MLQYHNSPRLLNATAGVFAFCALVCGMRPAFAAPPHYSDTLPLSEVKPGMVGYGLTTFKGTTVSKFQVVVVGILRKENAGHDLILVKMKGGPITERGANLIQGMSGSPIYLKGKIAGAFSMGEEFPKEPLGMVTPIDDMLEAWDPDIPQQPAYFVPANKPKESRSGAAWQPDMRRHVAVLPTPIDIDGRHISRLVLNATPSDAIRSDGSTAVLERCTTLLCVTGINERDRAWLQGELDKKGYALTVAQGPGIGVDSGAHFKGAPLKPGSAFGTFLATGDLEVGATGTLTYRRGDRMLGFGHPLFGLGALEGAITSAYILDVFSGLRVSHHIAVAGPVIGTLVQDLDFSVSGVLGRAPHLVPVAITVHDETSHRTKVFHSNLFQHPELTSTLVQLVTRDAISQVHDQPGDVMARVTTMVDAAEVGKISRSNVVFSSNDISSAATGDLGDIMNVVSGNPFYPLPIREASIDVDITRGHNTATIERIYLKQGRYEAGDNVEVGVVLKPYRRDPVVRTLTIPIPANTPSGRYPLIVRGGTPMVSRLGPFILSAGPQDQQAPPVNVSQMVTRLNEREHTTDIVARVTLASAAPAVEGEKLSQLPPNLAALMRSDRNSGVRLERDELKADTPSEYVITGMQQLTINIDHRNDQEPQSSSMAGYGSSGGSPGNTIVIPVGGYGSSQNDDNPLSAPAANDDQSWAGNGHGLAPLSARPYLSVPADGSAESSAQASVPSPSTTQTKPKADKGKQRPGPAVIPPVTATPAQTELAQAAPEAPDKPVGRRLLTWKQVASHDFASGTLAGLSVGSDGGLRLAPTLSRLGSTTETYVWALEPDDAGNLYAGTGTSGRILKIAPDGTISTFATLPVVSVQSLLRDKDGSFWAGTAVQGSLYHITANGSATLIATVPDKYILALAEDSAGTLFIGPGSSGIVYRLTRAELTSADKKPVVATPYLKTPAGHIMALAVDAHDNLYAGTADEGIVFRVAPDGKSSVLYDARQSAVTALTVDPEGNVYVGTGPRGAIYKIAADGTVTTLYDKASGFITAMRWSGRLYAASVNALYEVVPDGTGGASVVPFDNPRDVDLLSLALLPNGTLAVGTGNIGEIYQSHIGRDQSTTGVFTSVVHDSRLSSRWGAVRWEATTPHGCGIQIETRSGNVGEPDASWSSWAPIRRVAGFPDSGQIASPPGRFIQYRITLQGSGGATPTLSWIGIDYMPHNQPPTLSLQVPSGGEQWAGQQTIRWTASDPDNDTLSYSIYYSGDGGATWTPVGGDPGKPAASPSSLPAALSNSQTKIPDNMRQAIIQSLQRQKPDSGSLRETSHAWDTKQVANGVYRIKVVATDRLSNPTDALTVEAVSEPFLICNALPAVTVGTQTIGTDHTVQVEGSVTQSMLAITAVQYRIDGGEWVSATPVDGLFDSPSERFTFTTTSLVPGKHSLEVEAFNAAGGHITSKTDLDVK
jgi:hypothetical protein